MPQNKDLKRLVRTRMKKTGEAYTAARAQITSRSANKASRQSAKAPAPDYAALAGMSDATVKAKTGCVWERWVKSLDHHGAERMSHREVAALVHEKYNVPGWWAQAVTVGYERIKGLRERGQRRGGGYEAAKSRTYNVPVARLFEAWNSATSRRRFMDGAKLKVRTATSPKSMRLELEDGSVAALWFTKKSDSKSSVSVQHLKLRDRAAVERSKQYWSERLAALAEVVTS